MASCRFGFPEYSRATTLYTPVASGGSFTASLPVTNVLDTRLAKLARTTDAVATSTRVDIDLGVARAVGMLAALIPNLTKSSVPTIQWTGGTSVGASDVYDSGAVQAWPSGITAEDVASPDGTIMNVWLPTIPAAAQTARYWRCAVVDTANVDGHLDFARLGVFGAYTPSVNMSVGAKTALMTNTTATDSDGGATIFNVKARRRTVQFTLANLSTSEVFGSIRKMQRLLGISGQLFFVTDTADTTLMYERAYLCTMKEIGALDYTSGLYVDAAYSLTEVL